MNQYPLDQMSPRRSSASEAGGDAIPCAVCGSPMRRERRPWQHRCTTCGLRTATLARSIEGNGEDSKIDEDVREHALEPLRRANFERELDAIAAFGDLRGIELLDVGCAHGWFLDAASRRGCITSGIEPDAGMYGFASRSGHRVSKGFFPEGLAPGTTYDVITFNDVFEHLPDVNAALEACRERLRQGGILVLNLPDSRGTVFRTASLLDRIGLHGPLDRLWQKEFPSPHLYYFNPDSLAALARRHGFREVHRGELATIELRGLWQRLRYDRTASLLAAVVSWVAVTLALPVLRLLTSDISLQVFSYEPPRAADT